MNPPLGVDARAAVVYAPRMVYDRLSTHYSERTRRLLCEAIAGLPGARERAEARALLVDGWACINCGAPAEHECRPEYGCQNGDRCVSGEHQGKRPQPYVDDDGVELVTSAGLLTLEGAARLLGERT